MRDPDEPVVGYASFAVWQHAAGTDGDAADVGDHPAVARGADRRTTTPAQSIETEARPQSGTRVESESETERRGEVLLNLARASIREHLGIDEPSDDAVETIIARHPWLREPGASFVTLTENGRLRGCIGTLEAYRSLGDDVADHAVDAASRDPRFDPITAAEYPLIDVEVSVLGRPEPIEAVTPQQRPGDDGMKAGEPVTRPVQSRNELERALRPGRDGLILEERGGRHRRATFLPQVWEQLPIPHDFVSHLLAKAGLAANLDWSDGEIACERYEVTAYAER
ncbi:AmmeMemoRadiSam system protein A [Bifidobacterium jacchi]|uniref:AmmeMemoRadiSam system protein A n=2 Tax=Bifidobacterium jacchi TaxID=2490545 RepID=A0A5N5RH20_9BIFI|nr:AmmeMemoRadiSam system protein A [Bifidobacterium jacchi]